MLSKVYFLPWNKIDGLSDWLAEIGAFNDIKENDLTAIKIHFGEAGNTGYIRPKYAAVVADLLKKKKAKPFLTDANTIYVGQRADAVSHSVVADQHGFNVANCGCPVIIADGLRGNSGVDVSVNLKHFKTVQIANAVHYADSLVFMSHFKGHEISGFGGALKNIGMGCATRAGKYAMHDSVNPKVDSSKCTACGTCIKWCAPKALELKNKEIVMDKSKCIGCGECILSCKFWVFSIPWNEEVCSVQEKIVEFAKGVLHGKKHFSINFINHVTKFCDCYPTNDKVLLDNIGIMASADPVALDLASSEMVNKHYGSDLWLELFPEIDYKVQLKYAEKLGLGSTEYELVDM